MSLLNTVILTGVAVLAFLLGRASRRPVIRDLSWRAAHDPLTGLPNRAAASYEYGRRRTRGQVAVVLLDLTDFKVVNDTHGHKSGDDLLIVVARRLHTAAAALGGYAARLGGDEYVLLLGIDANRQTVTTILTDLAIPAQLHTDHGVVRVTPQARAGLVRGSASWEEALMRADIAQYHAHATGEPVAEFMPGMAIPPLPVRPGPARRGPRLRDLRPHRRNAGRWPTNT